VLLVAGIFTQLSALGLFILNIVAVISYYATLSQSPAAMTDHLQWGLMLAVLMTLPTHKISLEYLCRAYFPGRVQAI
jgi:putative oxidoreductase